MARKLYDQWAIAATIDPDAYAFGTEQLSDEIDMSKWHAIQAIVLGGTLGSSATLDAKLQGSTTSGGSYADISGKAITQLTQAGSDADKQAIIYLRADEQTRRYVKVALNIGVADSDAGVVVLGLPRYGPATDQDLASVDEVVG